MAEVSEVEDKWASECKVMAIQIHLHHVSRISCAAVNYNCPVGHPIYVSRGRPSDIGRDPVHIAHAAPIQRRAAFHGKQERFAVVCRAVTDGTKILDADTLPKLRVNSLRDRTRLVLTEANHLSAIPIVSRRQLITKRVNGLGNLGSEIRYQLVPYQIAFVISNNLPV
ncbi:hypothetical protein CBR71_03670 [Bordetella hinzii]|nr:hypothetical protein CBR71_03670 [Bordetella hinzii]